MGPLHMVLVLYVGSVASSKCTKVVTFNAGLTRSVPNYEKRRNETAKALLKLDADFLCLQEIWKEDDLQRLIHGVSKVYPYHFSALHPQLGNYVYTNYPTKTKGEACSESDVQYFKDRILPCAATAGCLAHLKTSGAAALACLTKNCKQVLNNGTFNADCLSCIAVTSSPTSVSFDDCTKNEAYNSKLNGPGLLLLSKKNLGNAKSHGFFEGKKMLLQRSYLTADHADIGRVVCTHLSSTTGPYLEYALEYGNYTTQLRAEANELIKKYGGKQHILLGDLNTGPRIVTRDSEKNLAPDDSYVFRFLLQHGYKAPYMQQDGRCTFCKSNPLANGTNEAIDHIMLKMVKTRSVTFKRVLDKPPISDHYGVQATLCR